MNRPKETMEWGLFEKIASEAVEFGIPEIGLNRFGEPLLHPKLADMIAFLKVRGAESVDFTTNGTLLTQDRARDFLEAGIDRIAVSIDGFKKATYEKIRIGASYDQVIENLHNLIELKKKMQVNTIIQLNFVCTKDTISEVEEFYYYWRKKIDSFFFIPFMGYTNVRGMSNLRIPKKRVKCYMLYSTLVCSSDGRGGVCCVGDPNLALDIGDLNIRTLKEVWNGPEVQKIRKIHREKRWNELPICAKCDLIFPYTYWLKHFINIYYRIYIGRP